MGYSPMEVWPERKVRTPVPARPMRAGAPAQALGSPDEQSTSTRALYSRRNWTPRYRYGSRVGRVLAGEEDEQGERPARRPRSDGQVHLHAGDPAGNPLPVGDRALPRRLG